MRFVLRFNCRAVCESCFSAKVHRIMKVHEESTGLIDVLTKGDNNLPDDREVSGCINFFSSGTASGVLS